MSDRPEFVKKLFYEVKDEVLREVLSFSGESSLIEDDVAERIIRIVLAGRQRLLTREDRP